MTTHQPPPPPSKQADPPAPRPATATERDAPINWQAIAEQRERELRRAQEARFVAEADRDAARRREWAAALRWFGQRNRRVENWMSAEHLATRIEDGTLTPWADRPDVLGDTTEAEPTPGPAGSCGCRTIDEHHRATEALEHEGSVDWLAQEFSRADQAFDRLPAWAQPIVVAKSEPTPGPVATANLATTSHGLAKPNPLPAGGPGWDRETILLGFQQIAAAVRADKPIRFDADNLAQLKALLADWDIAVRQRDSLALCPVCFVADHERVTGARTSWRLAPASKTDEVGHLVQSEAEMRHQLTAARAELAQVQGRVEDYRRDAWDRTAVVDALRAELATARRDAELWERAAGDMEARDRHAAADALEEAAQYVRKVFADSIDPEVGRVLEALAYTTRAGSRPVPGNPKPAPASERPAGQVVDPKSDAPEQWITTDPVRNPRLPRREADDAG
jgi:HAMP domain-containing protein